MFFQSQACLLSTLYNKNDL